MIVIADTHIKKIEPFYSSIKQFLEHLVETYPDEEVVQLGDLFDSSTTHADTMFDIIALLKRFKKIHILSGNHDQSRRSGNILLPLLHHDNIFVYNEMTEVEIEGHKCLMCPWVYNSKEVYEQVAWNGDLAFLHATNPEDAFGDDGVNTDKIQAYQVFGHTHTSHYISDTKIVLGVQVPSRNLEKSCDYLYVDKEGKKDFLVPEKYFEYQDLDYGQFPENKNNILNIKKAPSFQSVWDMYKGYYVRREGIEILRTENKEDQEKVAFELGNIVEKFQGYSTDKKLTKEVHECGVKYLQEVV